MCLIRAQYRAIIVQSIISGHGSPWINSDKQQYNNFVYIGSLSFIMLCKSAQVLSDLSYGHTFINNIFPCTILIISA